MNYTRPKINTFTSLVKCVCSFVGSLAEGSGCTAGYLLDDAGACAPGTTGTSGNCYDGLGATAYCALGSGPKEGGDYSRCESGTSVDNS